MNEQGVPGSVAKDTMEFRGRYHPAPGWEGLCRRDDRLQFVATADAFKVDRGKNIGELGAQHRVHAALSVAQTRRV